MNNFFLNTVGSHRKAYHRNRRLSIICLLLSFVMLVPTLKFYFAYIRQNEPHDLYLFFLHGAMFLFLVIYSFIKK